jgi:hypothetical protein
VGGGVVVFAVLLELFQALTPDRIADIHAAMYSAGGVLSAALPADLFLRASKQLNGRTLLLTRPIPRIWPRWSSRNVTRTTVLLSKPDGGVAQQSPALAAGSSNA